MIGHYAGDAMRIDRNCSVIRLYEHDGEYEAKRKWLTRYGEPLSVHDSRTGADGCFLIVPNEVVDLFLFRWPENERI